MALTYSSVCSCAWYGYGRPRDVARRGHVEDERAKVRLWSLFLDVLDRQLQTGENKAAIDQFPQIADTKSRITYCAGFRPLTITRLACFAMTDATSEPRLPHVVPSSERVEKQGDVQCREIVPLMSTMGSREQ